MIAIGGVSTVDCGCWLIVSRRVTVNGITRVVSDARCHRRVAGQLGIATVLTHTTLLIDHTLLINHTTIVSITIHITAMRTNHTIIATHITHTTIPIHTIHTTITIMTIMTIITIITIITIMTIMTIIDIITIMTIHTIITITITLIILTMTTITITITITIITPLTPIQRLRILESLQLQHQHARQPVHARHTPRHHMSPTPRTEPLIPLVQVPLSPKHLETLPQTRRRPSSPPLPRHRQRHHSLLPHLSQPRLRRRRLLRHRRGVISTTRRSRLHRHRSHQQPHLTPRGNRLQHPSLVTAHQRPSPVSL